MKSLYATISKRASSPSKAGSSVGGSSRRSRVTNEWFDSSPPRGGGGGGGRRMTAPPSAPPRRHRSSLNLNGGSRVYSDENSRRTSPWTTPAGSMKRSTMSRVSSSGRSQQTRPSNPSPFTRSTVNLRYGAGEEETKERKRSRVERRKTISSYDDVMENRDLPRFENTSGGTGSRSRSVMYGGSGGGGGGGHRESVSIRSDASSRGGRLFGQSDDGGADSDVGGSTRRPAPDMRRLLLNNVNASRKKSGGGGGGSGGRHVIRAI